MSEQPKTQPQTCKLIKKLNYLCILTIVDVPRDDHRSQTACLITIKVAYRPSTKRRCRCMAVESYVKNKHTQNTTIYMHV